MPPQFMASDHAGAATDTDTTPPPPAAMSPHTSHQSLSFSIAPVTVESLQDDATRATASLRSLKRPREATPSSPTSANVGQLESAASPNKIPRHSSLSGGPIYQDDQQSRAEYGEQVAGEGDDPAYGVHSGMMSGQLTMDGSQDMAQHGPTEEFGDGSIETDQQSLHMPINILSDTEAKNDLEDNKDRRNEQPNEQHNGHHAVLHSDASLSSLGGNGEPSMPTSQGLLDLDHDTPGQHEVYGVQPQAQMVEKGNNTSMSYPGVLPPPASIPVTPARGMSLPMSPGEPSHRSPGTKKHKCPNCDTEFTRHHNLKSHLLTHSNDKPYICGTCNTPFRRLHDLKRHSKLHTGEKPHVCPKCNRKFARGDALARHSKGPGGCVSRRGSTGLGDEEFDGASQLENGSTVSGEVYSGSNINESGMVEAGGRGLSAPSGKARQVPASQSAPAGTTFSRTYPLPGSAAARLYPSTVARAAVHSKASHSANAAPPNVNASMYSQTGMTESPKPLSPGMGSHDGSIGRQRSPGLVSQIQQQNFGRHQSDRLTSSGLSYLSSYTEVLAAQSSPASTFATTETGFAGPDPSDSHGEASTTQSGAGAPGQPDMDPGPASVSAGPNGAAEGEGNGDNESNNMFASDQGIWAYVHELEQNVRDLSSRVHLLEANEKAQAGQIEVLMDELLGLRQQCGRGPDVQTPEAVT